MAKSKVTPHSGAGIYKRYNAQARIGTVEDAVRTSKTHGQLRRKLTGMAVRKTTAMAAPAGSTRKQRASAIRKGRRQLGSKAFKGTIGSLKFAYAKEAANYLKNK